MAELRHVEEVLQDVTRQLRAAEGEEEALRAKVGHMRQEANIAQAACDRARAAEAAALRVNLRSLACISGADALHLFCSDASESTQLTGLSSYVR